MAQSKINCCDLWQFPHIHFEQSQANTNSWLNQSPLTMNFDFLSLPQSTNLSLFENEETNYFCQLPLNAQFLQDLKDDTFSKPLQNMVSENKSEPQLQSDRIKQLKNVNSTNNAQRKDLDGQSVFKLANYGLRAICKQYGYEHIIDFNGPQSQKSKDYFVLLLCYMEATMLKNSPFLVEKIPQLYSKAIKDKLQKVKSNLELAKTEKERFHAEHSLQVYENASRILEAYLVEKDLQKAMMLAYGANLKFNNRLQKAISNMRVLRKNLGLNYYIIESQVKPS